MKGVILAGGLGSRLRPLTKVTNKHLLPVYNKPMIYYPIETLVEAGIRDIVIVTGGNSSGDFMQLLGNGKELGLNSLYYAYQEGEGGIAHALALAESFCKDGKIVVALGDNLIEGSLRKAVKDFECQKQGAKVLIKQVDDPGRFGVVRFADDRIVEVIEKPHNPPSNYAVIGFYMYDSHVFDIIRSLKPSDRGELEISDVNNHYIAKGQMTHEVLEGWWQDAGTFESLHHAQILLRQKAQNHS